MQSYDELTGKLLISMWRSFFYANQCAESVFSANGLTFRKFAVLELLYNRGEFTVKQITEKVLSTGGNITVVIQKLETDGLIVRKANPNDNRSYLISITGKGREMMDVVFPAVMNEIERYFSKLTDEDKKTVVDILRKLRR